MEQPGLGERLPFRGPRLRCGQFGGLPRAWRSPAASLLRMSRRPGPAAVSGSPAARRVACPGTYWQPRQAAGGSFLRQGPGANGGASGPGGSGGMGGNGGGAGLFNNGQLLVADTKITGIVTGN